MPTALRVDSFQTGPIVALYQQYGKITPIRARSSSLQDIYETFWEIAHAIERHDPVRAEVPKSAAYSIEWQLPRWGQIVEIAQAYGPLPAGVSRLGSFFAATCQQCDSSAGRNETGRSLGDTQSALEFLNE